MKKELLTLRVQRIQFWHSQAQLTGWKFKLFAFFAGLELKALKQELGVSQGKTSDTVSEVESGWDAYVEKHCGFTGRSARRYVNCYENICQDVPALASRLIKAAQAQLQDGQGNLLPERSTLQPEEAVKLLSEKDLAAFAQAADEWSLHELYAKPEKSATTTAKAAHAKAEAERERRQLAFDFWLSTKGDFSKRLENKSYLRLPKPQRQQLADRLSLLLADIKQSLKGT